jgi:hypothetical protein
MELATCRYIDFPSVEVIDLEAPQLWRKCTRWRRTGCLTS